MRKIDDWIVARTQDAYLWLLDRTGVYVATCMMVLYFGGKFAWVVTRERPLDVVDYGFMLFMIVGMSMRWAQQGSSEAAFNAESRLFRESYIRTFFMFIWIPIILSDFVTLYLWKLRGACALLDTLLSALVLFYLMVVQVRKREPPERWVGAPARGGA